MELTPRSELEGRIARLQARLAAANDAEAVFIFQAADLFYMECFFGHLLSGENGAVPSWMESPTGGIGLSPAFGNGVSTRRIQAHEPILLDYAGACDGYHSDQMRLFSLGSLPDDLVKAHQACPDILEEDTVLVTTGDPEFLTVTPRALVVL